MVNFDTVFPSTTISTGYTAPSFKITKKVLSSTNTDLEPSRMSLRGSSTGAIGSRGMSLSLEIQPLRGRASRRDDWSTYISALVVDMTTPPSDVEQGRIEKES